MSRGWWFLLYLVVFWGIGLAFAIVAYAVNPGVDDGYAALRGLAVLAAIIYFAWAMPRTGRASWQALGLIVPALNAYLFFSTFWRLAGQRAGVLPPAKEEPSIWGVRPIFRVALALIVGLLTWVMIESSLPPTASRVVVILVTGAPLVWMFYTRGRGRAGWRKVGEAGTRVVGEGSIAQSALGRSPDSTSASRGDKDSLTREVPKLALVTKRWLRMAGYVVLGVAGLRLLVPVQHCIRQVPSGWTMPQLTARWLPWDAGCPRGWFAQADVVATGLQFAVLVLVAVWMLRARQ